MKTVRDIIREWLTANGYDGLWNEEVDGMPCGCGVDDFMPCSGEGREICNCMPAYDQGDHSHGPDKKENS